MVPGKMAEPTRRSACEPLSQSVACSNVNATCTGCSSSRCKERRALRYGQVSNKASVKWSKDQKDPNLAEMTETGESTRIRKQTLFGGVTMMVGWDAGCTMHPHKGGGVMFGRGGDPSHRMSKRALPHTRLLISVSRVLDQMSVEYS